MSLLAVAPGQSSRSMDWVNPVLVTVEEAYLRSSTVQCQWSFQIVIVDSTDLPNLVQRQNLVQGIHPGAK